MERDGVGAMSNDEYDNAQADKAITAELLSYVPMFLVRGEWIHVEKKGEDVPTVRFPRSPAGKLACQSWANKRVERIGIATESMVLEWDEPPNMGVE